MGSSRVQIKKAREREIANRKALAGLISSGAFGLLNVLAFDELCSSGFNMIKNPGLVNIFLGIATLGMSSVALISVIKNLEKIK